MNQLLSGSLVFVAAWIGIAPQTSAAALPPEPLTNYPPAFAAGPLPPATLTAGGLASLPPAAPGVVLAAAPQAPMPRRSIEGLDVNPLPPATPSGVERLDAGLLQPVPPMGDGTVRPPDSNLPQVEPFNDGGQYLFPPKEEAPAYRIFSQPVPNGYDRLSDPGVEEAFDQAGTLGNDVPPIWRRPYPYGHTDQYWYGQDADVERWGQLLELPYVRLGWFSSLDTTVFRAFMDTGFNSGTLIPGAPVILGAADLNWNASPKLDVGYRFEHGLGEIKVGYRYFLAHGTMPINGYGAGGLLGTSANFQTLDLDWCVQEFNSEGLPFILPLLKSWGRAGLGKALTPNWFQTPTEIRWIFGLRGATFYYESIAQGAALRERVMNNFNGAGLHFGIDLNARLRTRLPLFIHARAEGSGIFGFCDQTFERGAFSGNIWRDGIGVPTVTTELGLSYAPSLPVRSSKLTLAWQREEWFSFGNGGISSASIFMHGILLRGEYKF